MKILWLLVIGVLVHADNFVDVDGQDLSIKYTSPNGTDTGATWSVTPRGSTDCDTPQKITSRLGDTMKFTFTGTSVFVVGTQGPKRGMIQFSLDGNTTTTSRTASSLVCDAVLFQDLSLPYQQHTITATLVGRELNLQTQLQDGVLSIQRIRYTTPGGGSPNKTPGIVGGIVAGLAVILIVGIVSFLWVRRRRRNQGPRRGGGGAFFDTDDVPHTNTGKDTITPGLVATPFEWNQAGTTEDGNPGSPTNQPLLFGSHYGVSATNNQASSSGSGGRPALSPLGPVDRRTSSGGSDHRQPAGFFANNPDRDTNTSASHTKASRSSEKLPQGYPMAPIRQQNFGAGPSGAGGEDLVDRIAERLANIMAERVGVAADPAPPMYSGPAEPSQPVQPYSPPATAMLTPSAATAYSPPAATSPQGSEPPRIPPPPGSTAPLVDTDDPAALSNANRFGPRPRPAGARASVSGPGSRPNMGSRPNTGGAGVSP